ncbi:MAG: glycosyltransferase family 2 protein [Actinomycetota bacterium]|nr:glycosyltransferase family 2 protein [Actinomycetota bacterium]MDQ2980760.1 glycosyltransferase family 2 protein [Actinomycetota bacterium]
MVVVAYDSGPALPRLLHSLESENGGDLEALVVDNGAGGPEIAEASKLPWVRLVKPNGNLGFAGGSNLGAREARGEVLVFLNPDTVVESGAIEALVRALEDDSIGIAMARLRLLDRPELLNSGGNVVHVSGLAWAGGFGEPAEQLSTLREVAYPTGAAMAIRAGLFEELGGFCEQLFMYQEDLELGWRVRLRGLRVVVEPKADVYHEYDFSRHGAKHYLLERNRLIFVLTAYSPRLLALLSPVLLGAELGVATLALRQRWLGEKAAGWKWLLANRRWLSQRRRETQGLRRVPDRELARYLTPVLDPHMIDLPRSVRFVNPLVAGYWRAVRKLL